MNAMILMIATSAVGVNPGWQPTGDGGLEYIIQIEPDFCEKFPPGGITSTIPHEMLNSINRIRIVVGNESSAPLPHENLPAAVRPIPIPSNAPRSPTENSLEPRGGSLLPRNSKETVEPNGNQNGLPYTQPREQPDRNDGNTEASLAPRIPTYDNGGNTQRFTGKPAETTEPERPWWALTGCLVALFASLGGNLYQGLAHFNLRQRYQALIERVQSPSRA